MGNSILDILRMSKNQKGVLDLEKHLIFWLVTEMLSFPKFVEKCCDANFFVFLFAEYLGT